jgi:hypothetical protein
MKSKRLLVLKVLFIVCIIIVASCVKHDKMSQQISGSWIIENIKHKGINYNDSLRYNMIFFTTRKGKNIVTIPNTTYSERTISSWEKIDNNHVKINSQNKVFSGDFKIKYYEDKGRRLVGMHLSSRATNIEAYKIGEDYIGK